MKQEIYLDILFLTNMAMDYLILLTVRTLLKCTATQFRIALGAAVGAGFTCLSLLVPVPYWWIRLICFHLMINTCMVIIGLRIKSFRRFFQALALLYISAFLYGGILEWLSGYSRILPMFLAVGVLSFFLVKWILGYLYALYRQVDTVLPVVLYGNGGSIRLQALVDTGNHLRDPYTGKPVCVVEKKRVMELFENMDFLSENAMRTGKFRLIPYTSVGREHALLPAITLEKMCILQRETLWINQPVIALWDGSLGSCEQCQMIMNPDVMTQP